MRFFSTFRYVVSGSLLSALLAGCAPTVTTLRLEPVSGEVAQLDGRSVTKAEQHGVGVVASFEREDMDYVALDVEIKNHTGAPLEVDPANFRLVALGEAQDTLRSAQQDVVARQAASPTYEASRIDLKRKQEEKRLKRAKIINTVLLVATIASDVSSTSRSRSYGEYMGNRAAHSFAYQGIAAKRAIDYGTFASRMEQYDYEAYRWRELALMPQTLPADHSVRGFVYLPKVPNATYLAISYAQPEQATVPLLFRQDYVKQRRARR